METCKKSGRNLPEGYKHKVCQNCMGKDADKLKKVVGGAAAAIGLLAFGIAKKIVLRK